jgi:hypothetical protein
MKPQSIPYSLRFSAAAVFALAASACFSSFGVPSQADMQAQAEQARKDGQAHQDEILKDHLEQAIAKAQSGGPREAAAAAASLTTAYQTGAVERGAVSADAMITVRGLLDREMTKSPDEKPALLAARGRLELASGQREAAIRTLQESMKERPTLGAFLVLATALDEAGRSSEIVDEAKRTLAQVTTDDERFEVLFAVVHHTHATSAESGLAWASASDRKLFAEEKARRDEQARIANEEHRRKQEEHSAKMRADFDESRRRQEEARRCSSRCDADLSSCKSKCFGNAGCSMSCEDASRHCRSSCS